MFPIILLTNSQKATEEYINKYISEYNFHTNHIEKIAPLKATITIDQIRELKKELKIVSGNPRLIIFESFHTTNLESQNALLKVLEESTVHNQFVLITPRLEHVLPTIISRCTVVKLEKKDHIIDQSVLEQITAFLKKPDIRFLANPVFLRASKEEAANLLTDAIHVMGKEMKSGRSDLVSVIKKTFDLLHKLQNNNLSPQLTVDSWIIMVVKSRYE